MNYMYNVLSIQHLYMINILLQYYFYTVFLYMYMFKLVLKFQYYLTVSYSNSVTTE